MIQNRGLATIWLNSDQTSVRRGKGESMKKGIHPTYEFANVSCACGMSFQTRTTVGDLKVDICSSCHPFFTGTQKIVDAEGRVERFNKKYLKKATTKTKAKV